MDPSEPRVDSLPAHIDDCRLMVRNLPADFRPAESRQLLALFGATAVHPLAAHCSLVSAEFPNPVAARAALRFLHQKTIAGSVLCVEFARRSNLDEDPETGKLVQPVADDVRNHLPRLDKFVGELNATASHFAQPPPPNLRYSYPKASRDILDAICIALETTPRFYTQVLHLMNRMNLEPPFVAGDRKLRFANEHRDCGTQTDRNELLASDESELESSAEDNNDAEARRRPNNKRIHSDGNGNGNGNLLQKRFRLMRMQTKTVVHQQRSISTPMKDVFPSAPLLPATPSIIIRVPNANSSTMDCSPPNISKPNEEEPISVNTNTEPQPTLDSLRHERIPVDQLAGHPLFMTYDPGKPNAKLYVKNLAKAVSDEQIHQIFALFTPRDQSSLGTVDVRVMRTGRMKGQAFVTYGPGPYLTDEHVLAASRRARFETNGLILGGRPIVVVFGKQTSD